MCLEPEGDEVPVSSMNESDLAIAREQIVERIHFLFRQAGGTAPALELEQQIMTYRLLGMQQ